jgi:hypothetical protein
MEIKALDSNNNVQNEQHPSHTQKVCKTVQNNIFCNKQQAMHANFMKVKN